MKLSNDLDTNIKTIKTLLPIKKSFDVIGRDLIFKKTKSYLVFVDGFVKDELMMWLLENFQSLPADESIIYQFKDWIASHLGYIEVDITDNFQELVDSVLSGTAILLFENQTQALIIDARTYPARGPEEPDLEKVTRGSRDGLVETIVFNTALIRRRIRDANLIFEMKKVGKRSKTDVVLAYIDDLVDKNLLKRLENKIDNIKVDALLMAEKSLDELIIKKKWYNPLPQAKFSERPDVVSAHLLEGHIGIIVDTSPSIMLLPTTLFHFTQHSEDYYQNPLVGTYIRWIRFLAIIASLILSPLWLLLVNYQEILPDALQFIGPREAGAIPIFLQFVILEIGLDVLRIASIHTPNTLSTSLGIIGGLMISQFAVDVGWFIPETVLYMAVVGIGTFATPSIEFAMAIRLFRLLLLVLTGLLDTWGFIIGMILIFIIVITTKTYGKLPYTWPFIPFNAKAFSNVLLRKPIIEIKRNKKK